MKTPTCTSLLASPAEQRISWLLLLLSLGVVCWLRLLPLSLAVLDDRAEELVRRRISQRIAQASASSSASAPGQEERRRQVEKWIAEHRQAFEAERAQVAQRLKAQLRYQGDDGKEYVYLGDFDSYVWLRNARNYLQNGATCDAVVAGKCLDAYTHAPVGGVMQYNHSFHIVVIVALHQFITFFSPHYPLPASAFLVPVVSGLLGVLPAFFLGRVVGGNIGGVFAALLSALYHQFLVRSIGGDNDVWNVVLPLFMLWALWAALQGRTAGRRIWCGALAGMVCGLHAGTWPGWRFFFILFLGGLLGSVFLYGCKYVVQQRTAQIWRSAAVRNTTLVCGAFFMSAGVSVALALGSTPSLAAFATAGVSLRSFFVAETPSLWPSNFSTVTELLRPDFAVIVDSFWGGVLFCGSLLGLLLLFLPKKKWRWRHWALLCGGCGVFVVLLVAAPAGRRAALGFGALPFIGAGVSFLVDEDAQERLPFGLALSIVGWFFGAWWLAYQGLRFLILLAPPFALGCASVVGKLFVMGCLLLRRLGLPCERAAKPLLFAGLASLLIDPLQGAHIVARRYLPAIEDAWWDAFTKIRDESSSEAIINVWWDYGYWAKYVAERRVSNDGGSLQTHIPHWLGLALVTPDEAESIGVLCMLNCGSDALPYPEGQRGAYAQILAAGYDAITAHDIIMELVHLDRAAAQLHLSGKGFSSTQQEQILNATHCTPPDSYLVVASEQLLKLNSWMHLGLWDFRRAYLVRQARFASQTEAVRDLTTRFGYTEDEATQLYVQARTLQSDEQTRNFIAPLSGALSLSWIPCQTQANTTTVICPIDMVMDGQGSVLQMFSYNPQGPDESLFHLHSFGSEGAGRRAVGPPEVVMWANGDLLRRLTPSSPVVPSLGVMVDVPHQRIIIGSTPLVQSTMVQLLYLDGRYARHYEKFDERATYQGTRVVTWRVCWDECATVPVQRPAALHSPPQLSAPRPE